MTFNLEKKAEEFVTIAHKGQYRSDGMTPYIEHPRDVVNLLKKIGITDDDVLAAAWLHDVIEDCNVSKHKLKLEFNSHVSTLVCILTKEGSKTAYFDRISTAPLEAKLIKLADVAHNCQTLTYLGVTPDMIKTKIEECDKFYLPLAKQISALFYNMINSSLSSLRGKSFVYDLKCNRTIEFGKWYSPIVPVDGRYWMEDGFD